MEEVSRGVGSDPSGYLLGWLGHDQFGHSTKRANSQSSACNSKRLQPPISDETKGLTLSSGKARRLTEVWFFEWCLGCVEKKHRGCDLYIRLRRRHATGPFPKPITSATLSETHSPHLGGPDRIRTCDLLLRRQALYPAELRDHDVGELWFYSRYVRKPKF